MNIVKRIDQYEELGLEKPKAGHHPYSNSKSGVDIIHHGVVLSFLQLDNIGVSARSKNSFLPIRGELIIKKGKYNQ